MKTASRSEPKRDDVIEEIKSVLKSPLMASLLEREGMLPEERDDIQSHFIEKEFPETMSGREILNRLTHRDGTATEEEIRRLEDQISELEQRKARNEKLDKSDNLGDEISKLTQYVQTDGDADKAIDWKHLNRLQINYFHSQLEKKKMQLEEARNSPALKVYAAYCDKLHEIGELTKGHEIPESTQAIAAYILLHSLCMGKGDEEFVHVLDPNHKKLMGEARDLVKNEAVIEFVAKKLAKPQENVPARVRSNDRNAVAQLLARLKGEAVQAPTVSRKTQKEARSNLINALEALRSDRTLVQIAMRRSHTDEAELTTQLEALQQTRDGMTDEGILINAYGRLATILKERISGLTEMQPLIAGYLYLHAIYPGMTDADIAKRLMDTSVLRT